MPDFDSGCDSESEATGARPQARGHKPKAPGHNLWPHAAGFARSGARVPGPRTEAPCTETQARGLMPKAPGHRTGAEAPEVATWALRGQLLMKNA